MCVVRLVRKIPAAGAVQRTGTVTQKVIVVPMTKLTWKREEIEIKTFIGSCVVDLKKVCNKMIFKSITV